MAHALLTARIRTARNVAVGVAAAWFLLALGGSLLGVFDSEPRPPVLLGLGAVVPVAAFAAGYAASQRLREFVLSLDLRVIAAAQTWRVGGLVFVVLYGRGVLPGAFAIPAGWGDFAIGITAPLIAWIWKPPFPRKTFLVWNVLGAIDLLTAVTMGVLCSATAAGLLATDVSTRPMGQFPLSLIPTFFVPLLLICHLIAFLRTRRGAF